MNLSEESESSILDPEWVELILIAKYMGLTPDEVRKFINENKVKNIHNKVGTSQT